MQTTMDSYAGGIATGYAYEAKNLQIAKEHIDYLITASVKLRANTAHGIMQIYEVIDRLYICKILLCHLAARQETRWHAFQENLDYPLRDDEHWLKFVNSRYDYGQNKVEVLLRSLVKKDDIYEHKN
jgi:adenylylsulfate reductase subunit A